MIETPLLIGLIALVLVLLLIVLVVFGLKRKKSKTVSFTPKEEIPKKELTQEQKSGNYQAKGGFNFAPATTSQQKEPELLPNQKMQTSADASRTDSATVKAQQQLDENIAPGPVDKNKPLINEPVTPEPEKAPRGVTNAAKEEPQLVTNEVKVGDANKVPTTPTIAPETATSEVPPRTSTSIADPQPKPVTELKSDTANEAEKAKEAKKEEASSTQVAAGSAAAAGGVAGAGVAAAAAAKATDEERAEEKATEAEDVSAPEPIIDSDSPTHGTAESEATKDAEAAQVEQETAEVQAQESEPKLEEEFAELDEFEDETKTQQEAEYERPEETELTHEAAQAVNDAETQVQAQEEAQEHASAHAEKEVSAIDQAQAQAHAADLGEYDPADVPDAEAQHIDEVDAVDPEATEAAVAAATIEEAVEQALDKVDTEGTAAGADEAASHSAAVEANIEEIDPAAGRIGRLRGRLAKSQNVFGQSVLGMLSAGDLDEDAWEEIEDELLQADLGANITMAITDELREKIAERGVSSEAEARAMLRETLIEACHPELDRSIKAMPFEGKPAVILVVGVNGTGKTTTTGKLARVLVSMGHNVVLGAADTFRAAAADQLETWGRRVGAKTVRGKEGADPASVAFDAVAEGVATGADVVLIDTAGRLHNSNNLMDQLGKVKRVVEKKAIVDEVLLVLDATTGQNGMLQAKAFREVVNITGVVLTKLDGSAKGGIVFRVQEELGVPVKLVGLGEGADHLAPFEVEGFVDALLGTSAH